MDREIMIKLINEGTISIPTTLIENYQKLDIDESEVMLLIHVHSFIQRGNLFPTPDLLAERVTYSESECFKMLQSLMKRGFIEIKEHTDEKNIKNEVFSLSPLWDKLIVLAYSKKGDQQVANKEADEGALFELFEAEFARPLSPMECELITMWLDQDHYNPSLIKTALMEAVVSGKRNLRYIDRILIEWYKNGVKTVQQAKEYGEKFRSHQYKNSQAKPPVARKKQPSYNWLRE